MSTKNRTYERALSAFFDGDTPTDEQKERLPSEVDGLSVRRKKLINAVLEADSTARRMSALKRLNQVFGLPANLTVLSYALTPDDPNLSLKALKKLSVLLTEEPNALILPHKEALLDRLRSLEIRTFNEEALMLTQRCVSTLKALPTPDNSPS